MIFVLVNVFKVVSFILPILIAVAYFTIAERKIMGAIQRRKGPNVIGYLGLMQPLADGLKLFIKEAILPTNASISIFLAAPCLTFLFSLIGWTVIPLAENIVICDLSLGILYLFTLSALNVYGILLAGWSSNSKYAFLGAVRSAAQMISYEISLGFTALCVVLCVGSFNLSAITLAQKEVWFFFPLLPVFIIFYISMLAETNRPPFDLPEAEAELVSGYNVEYSGMAFALFFLAEYANMLLMSVFSALLYLGGWLLTIEKTIGYVIPETFWLCFKTTAGVTFFILTRATLPRYRYDQLMYLGWKCFLPLTLGYLLFTVGILTGFNCLPT